MKKLFDYLIQYGGSIVSSNSLTAEMINQARASERMWVDDNGLGFIWEPGDFKDGPFPTTEEEVELFEKWYPLPVELPKDLTYENMLKIIEERKQRKNN